MKRQKLKLTRKSHIWIHTIVFDDTRLKTSDKLVYLTLARFVNNETQECFPSIEKICEVSGLTNRTVTKSLRKLEKYNYIEIRRSTGNVNTYVLLEPEGNKYNIPVNQEDEAPKNAETTPPTPENAEEIPPEKFAGVQNDTREGVQNNTTTPPKITPLTSTYLTKESKDCADENQHPPLFFSKGEIKYEELLDGITGLSGKERAIFEMRFGLDRIKTIHNLEEFNKIKKTRAHTLEETGKAFGVTRERIRQIEEKALGKIEEILKKETTPIQEKNDGIPPVSEGKKEEINTRDFFLGEIKPLFLEMLDKYRQVEYYAFDYVKEIAIVKRWIKQVKEKQPDWGEEEIAPRLKSYIKHWFEAHDNDPPSISRIFSSNSLNEYRFWVAKTHPSQINTSL